MNRTTLDQWRCLLAFAESGTYAGAGAMLHKTPSSVFQAMTRLAAQLGVELVQVEGRRSHLTDQARALLHRAERLVNEFSELESMATDFAAGWEAEIGLAVESIFPGLWLDRMLADFSGQARALRLQVYEGVLSRIDDLLHRRKADIAISPRIPAGFIGEPLLSMELLAVSHPEHPLQQQPQPITLQQLAAHRQFVIRDEGSQPDSAGWQQSEQRWTVSSFTRSKAAVVAGLGFGRFAAASIADELRSGQLQLLPLREGARMPVQMFLVYADRDHLGPGATTLAQSIARVAAAVSPNAAVADA
ncbi:MAG: LysR family transcriptional regulator [Wenzhouxiangellaceae bacterium]